MCTGLRSAPIFDQYDSSAAEKYLFDISYQVFIIVIMVAIITGIIIDTFSDLRVNRAAVQANQQNVCFICGHKREQFEKHRLVTSIQCSTLSVMLLALTLELSTRNTWTWSTILGITYIIRSGLSSALINTLWSPCINIL